MSAQIAIEAVNVFIARDGAIIGEYPREQLEEMAQAGELQQDDHYWQEGMVDWLPLPQLLAPDAWEPGPPPPPPPNYRAIFGGIAAALIVVAILGFFFIKPDWGDPIAATNRSTEPDAATALQLRDKAAADLRGRIERLPAQAVPPLNAFYYDVSVNMKKTFSRRTPWIATIHGFENIVEPGSQRTILRTNFVLSADFQDGAWVFKHYRASITKMREGITANIEQAGNDPTPPSIVVMLGLKSLDSPDPISLKIPQR